MALLMMDAGDNEEQEAEDGDRVEDFDDDGAHDSEQDYDDEADDDWVDVDDQPATRDSAPPGTFHKPVASRVTTLSVAGKLVPAAQVTDDDLVRNFCWRWITWS